VLFFFSLSKGPNVLAFKAVDFGTLCEDWLLGLQQTKKCTIQLALTDKAFTIRKLKNTNLDCSRYS